MNLNIIGRHFDITPSLRKQIENKFVKIINHFDYESINFLNLNYNFIFRFTPLERA